MCHLVLVFVCPLSQAAVISLRTRRIWRLRFLSHCSWSSIHLRIKQLCDVLASCEPEVMVQLGWGSGYYISAETAGIRFSTKGRPNLLVLVFEYCASLVAHCHGSVSHELHCWLLGDINGEPLTVPVGCTSVSYWVVQNSGSSCGTASILLYFIFLLSWTLTCNNSTCN
jgi:hypothetical protein